MSYSNLKGNVTRKAPGTNAVLIESEGKEQWYTLGEKVKMNYVPDGECEFSAMPSEQGNPTLTFIKGTGQKKLNFQKPAFKPASQIRDNQDRIEAQFCVREAIRMIAEHNRIKEAKGEKEAMVSPTVPVIRAHASLVKGILDDLLIKPEEA